MPKRLLSLIFVVTGVASGFWSRMGFFFSPPPPQLLGVREAFEEIVTVPP